MKGPKIIGFVLTVLIFAAKSNSQINLLQDVTGSQGTKHWKIYGNAKVEIDGNGNQVFALRDGGYFFQDVYLEKNSAGKFALLISRCSSERVESNGTITGLPYLYGYMLNKASPKGGVIDKYLEGEYTLCRPGDVNTWSTNWGIFEVPATTIGVRFFLNQAERKGVPQNGSAAKFADVGLYLFDTENEAREFVSNYKRRLQ